MAKSLKESSDSRLRHLSYDLIFMILVRLPVKSLLQFKSVCSLWHSIISDPRFIKAHLDTANDVHKLCLRRHLTISPVIRSTGLKDGDTRIEHTTPVTEFSRNVEILGSCNGLLLLGDDDHTYYLWNPSTSLLREFSGPCLFRGEFRNFGLGYDSTSTAYKVVRIVRVTSHKVGFRPPVNNKFGYDATSAQVYNCKTDCWKKIEDVPYVIFEDAQGVTIDGVPHWVMFRVHQGEDEIIDLAIVYFDFAEEKFKEIPKPNWLVPSSIFEFGVSEGLLCLVHYSERAAKVWLMEKYGQDSWYNSFSLPSSSSGRIPGWSSARRIMWGMRSQGFKEATYVESLVSPHGGSDATG